MEDNRLSEHIRVFEGEVEQVNLPDMVDVIISEPMGYMLVNERLMENFLFARRWLKPNGRNPDTEVKPCFNIIRHHLYNPLLT